VERIEEFAVMAGMNIVLTSSRQRLTAERVAGYGAEQRRLKAAAADRRAAAALRAATGEETDHSVAAGSRRPPAVVRPSHDLR
jgi:hypothetical protein